MKKVKIMLTAVIVLGTVGGVLAYKAKRHMPTCTAATVNGACPANNPCGNQVVQAALDPMGSLRCTAIPHPVNGCANKVCAVFARTILD